MVDLIYVSMVMGASVTESDFSTRRDVGVGVGVYGARARGQSKSVADGVNRTGCPAIPILSALNE